MHVPVPTYILSTETQNLIIFLLCSKIWLKKIGEHVRQTEPTALVGVLAKEVGPRLRVCPPHLVYPVHFL